MTRPSAGGRRQPRSVTLAYGAVSLFILLVVAMVALVVSPPSPPALAEFAPRVEEAIDETSEQSSRFGTGTGGGCAAGQLGCEGIGRAPQAEVLESETAGPPPTTPRAPRRRCIGDPPRQTEDPQSPPCTDDFVGDNGGATSRGVTRDEIRVAVVVRPGALAQYWGALLPHFNKRYEFYGRTIRLVLIPKTSSRPAEVEAAKDHQAFAILDSFYNERDVAELHAAAARQRIVSVIPFAAHATAADYQRHAPYAWSYAPAADEVQAELGDFVCSSLRRDPARFAGPAMREQPRRYAVLRARTASPVDTSELEARLRRCDIEAPPVYDIDWRDDRDVVTTTTLALSGDNITSLLLLADADYVTQWARDVPSHYQPEWITSGFGQHDQEAQYSQVMPPEFLNSLFGTMSLNKVLPGTDTPAGWAYMNEGEELPTSGADVLSDHHFHFAYRALLLLSSGIQLAGPHLTPQSFANGLQRARFPNPGAGAAPYYQAAVGFGPGDYAMTHGSAVVWWSQAAPSYSGGGVSRTGAWCYVRRGTRFDRQWPDLSPELFDLNRPCR